MLSDLELKLIRKEIELKFGVREDKLKNLYYINKELFKQIVNWLYWDKSIVINDILKIFNWSEGTPTYRKIYEVLQGRKEIHNHKRDRLSLKTQVYLAGMRITDITTSNDYKYKRVELLTDTSNYYSCMYFYNVFNNIRHVSIYCNIKKMALSVRFVISIPCRNFNFDICDKSKVLNWVEGLDNDLFIDFCTACIDSMIFSMAKAFWPLTPRRILEILVENRAFSMVSLSAGTRA